MRANERALQLAFEIDAIVRSIENEKASEEDRTRTRDVWARIDGINDRALLSPRSDRLLISEAAMWSLSTTGNSTVAAGRRTFSDAARTVDDAHARTAKSKTKATRRLSDMTGMGNKDDSAGDKKKKQPSIGSKRDVWLVTFTDVVIRCQRVGVTNLSMQNTLDTGKTPSTDIKDTRRRTILLSRERNLYKFLKIDHWIMTDKTSPGRAGIVSMADVVNSRRTDGEVQEDDDAKDAQLLSEPVMRQVKFERDEEPRAELNGTESRMR